MDHTDPYLSFLLAALVFSVSVLVAVLVYELLPKGAHRR